jgi:hypothetical protein
MVMGSYGLGFDTRQLRFRLCSLCGGPEADGMLPDRGIAHGAGRLATHQRKAQIG